MRLFYLPVLCTLMIAGCQRPSVDDPTPVTPPQVPEPPLVDIQSRNDSLYIDSQLIYTRTTTADVRFSCRFGITNSAFSRKRIREYGFCLSATDSVLSVKNPQHLRLKATFDSVNYQFEAITQDLIPAKDYYVEPYFIMQDGRVYYGRYLNAPRLQTPSWAPRPSMNAITRFRINPVDKSIYSPVTLVNRTTVPITTLNYDFYSFICNENLYVLDRNGNLFQYDASQDKWLPRQRLTIEPSGSFNGWPALVFGVNNKGYVLYSDALVPNPTFHWEYNPEVDQWTKLGTPNKPILAPYNYSYQTGNQVFLVDTYQKRMVRFDAVQKDVQSVSSPNLVNYLISNQSLLIVSGNPYAYFGNYDENGNGSSMPSGTTVRPIRLANPALFLTGKVI